MLLEIASLVLEYLSVLVWPVLVGIIVFAFKLQIEQLLKRIVRAKFPGGEIELGEEIGEIQASVGKLDFFTEQDMGEQVQILKIVNDIPSAGLGLIRSIIETEINRIYDGIVVEPEDGESRPMGLSGMTRYLMHVNVLKFTIGNLILDFLPLANRVVHGEPINQHDAENLAMLGIQATAEIRRVA